MRLFIAFQLTDSMKCALVSVQEAMRRGGARGNFTRVENLHLTLAFIGEYPDPDRVLDAMEAVSFDPIPLRLEGLGSFRDLYWCGLAGGDALSVCAARLRRALAEADIPFDRKRFTPHITLLRRAVFDRGVPGVSVPAAAMEADALSLMRSDRGRNGMIYTELGRVPAAGR